MPKFHETGMGRKFYEADVPRTIKALESIAKSLSVIANSKDSNALQSKLLPEAPPPPPGPPIRKIERPTTVMGG